MRYRRLDANGDMTFGQGQGNFFINQPEGVGQWVMTRLRLGQGEWFADTSDGTPWSTQVLGERTSATRDIVVRERVQTTPNVIGIANYYSVMDGEARDWTARMTIDTVYGAVALAAARLPGTVPPLPAAAAAPIINAQQLGVTGGTSIGMTPADLTQGPRSDIRDFAIQRLEAGRW
jgi:hypothetical protein